MTKAEVEEDEEQFDIFDQARVSMWEYRLNQRTDLVFYGGMSNSDVLKLTTVERDYFMQRLIKYKEERDAMTLGGLVASQAQAFTGNHAK